MKVQFWNSSFFLWWLLLRNVKYIPNVGDGMLVPTTCFVLIIGDSRYPLAVRRNTPESFCMQTVALLNSPPGKEVARTVERHPRRQHATLQKAE